MLNLTLGSVPLGLASTRLPSARAKASTLLLGSSTLRTQDLSRLVQIGNVVLADENVVDPMDDVDRDELRQVLEGAVESPDPREREILHEIGRGLRVASIAPRQPVGATA